MKKITTVILMSFAVFFSFGQSGVKKIKTLENPYVGIDVDYYDRKAKEMQSKFDKNQEKYYKIKMWISNLKGQTDEQQFLNSMSYYSKKLDGLIDKYHGNLALATADLYEIEIGINDEINKYNNRVRNYQETNRNNYQDNNYNNSYNQNNTNNENGYHYIGNYLYKTSFVNPPGELPIREYPRANSRELYYCPTNAKIYVIEKSSGIYYKVHVNGYTGYLTKHYLRIK